MQKLSLWLHINFFNSSMFFTFDSDWKKMSVTPIHRKNDKLNPENYRAISLLSTPGKLFNKCILNKIVNEVNLKLSENPFGFRPIRGTTGAIFMLCQIIEKTDKHNISLHMHFIDFKAAFDTMWRSVLWKILRAVQIHQKVGLIEELYNGTESLVLINGNMSK